MIVDQNNISGLRNFATNAAAGVFTLAGNQSLTTTGGNFTNAGSLAVAAALVLKNSIPPKHY